ncbi:MAG: hypothetical protein M0Z83_05875 [Betaproteobacteria bacterium]|nr:hypothetical protein [Betaproteobacteria bacterium]
MKALEATGDAMTLFGGEASPVITQLLREAAACYEQTPRAEAILWSAQAIDPHCLPVYFSLYKFYFYKARLEDAEKVAQKGLDMAAGLGGFSADWTKLSACSAQWHGEGPQHFYLFTLKALAFMRLRLGKFIDSRALIHKLEELDPADTVGYSVIREVLQANVKAH